LVRARFQRGWLAQRPRKHGAVWLYHFREYSPSGKAQQRTVTIGPVSKYPTEADANRAVELIRLNINQEVTDDRPGPLLTVEILARHYTERELGNDHDDDDYAKSSTTKDIYESILKNWIVPKWGQYRLKEVRTIAIQDWLRGLTRKAGGPLARSTKSKIRNVMHVLYEHAIRYEFTERNPVTQVRQSAKRESLPDILDASELATLLSALGHRERAMVLIDAAAGLRRSELFALKWGDIDFQKKLANVTRSIFHNTKRERVGRCKTEASRKPVPLDDVLLEQLSLWRQHCEYPLAEDWIWASPATHGKFPYWPQTIMLRNIRPTAKTVGITKHIGWHTFRHSLSSLLRANGEDIKVVQELLRHANSKITLDIYTQALSPTKREAQSKVVRMIWNKETASEEEK
jgi:integrase